PEFARGRVRPVRSSCVRCGATLREPLWLLLRALQAVSTVATACRAAESIDQLLWGSYETRNLFHGTDAVDLREPGRLQPVGERRAPAAARRARRPRRRPRRASRRTA